MRRVKCTRWGLRSCSSSAKRLFVEFILKIVSGSHAVAKLKHDLFMLAPRFFMSANFFNVGSLNFCSQTKLLFLFCRQSRIVTGLLNFTDDRLDSLVESSAAADVAEARDERPPFDVSADDGVIVDGLAAMVENFG